MTMRWWIPGCVGLMVLVSACGSEPVTQDMNQDEQVEAALADQPAANSEGEATAIAVSEAPAPEVFADVEQPLPPAPENFAGLIPATTTPQRLPQVSAGRTDPFATIATTPIVVPSASSAQPPSPGSLQPVPAVPQPTVLPAPVDVGTLPTVPVVGPIVPGATPGTAAVAPPELEISGVVQVGDRWNVIVHVPGEATSRYVGVGAVLENGRTVVRRVEVVANQEPRVILERDGVEVIRTVGS
jgi:hypothetical protein